MAAKPPKPPATFLKRNSHGNNSDNSANLANDNNNDPCTSTPFATTTPTTPTSATTSKPLAENFSKLGIRRYNSRDNLLNNISNDNNNSDSGIDAAGGTSEGAATARPACNCTNISIMHLFHEMKQEFPTIPDPIVAQCVNENCHQRENCIQMLRNELALNPTPAQTYPAKVLQQHNINQQHNSAHQSKPSFQQQQHQQQQRQNSPQAQTSPHTSHPQPPQRHKNAVSQKPATPLRPIRAAPTQPPPGTLPRKQSDVRTNCDSVELVQNNSSDNNICNNSGNLLKDAGSAQLPCNNHSNNNNSVGEFTSQTCDMPATASATTNRPAECARSSDFIAALNKLAATPPQPPPLIATRQRARPNTLNLQASQQQLQRQQLNKQLQQHLQQRCQLQQLQPLTVIAADAPQQKPIRKAPLPPIAPKPVFHNQINNSHNLINNNNNNSCGNSPQSQSGGSYSTESNLTSPISSCGESEFAVNVVSTSQAFALGHNKNNNNNNNSHTGSAAPAYQQQPSSPLKSPIRHRSVITVQPEPPYARDFLPPSKISTSTVSNSSAGGSASSTPTSQKSFTSVNLTLRQPTAAAPQSTIDISAGPALSGNGSGLTYSSTSYDARRGYQQNFHITVTDQGGAFNASRIRPRNSSYYAGVEQQDSPGGPAGGVSPTAIATHQQQQPSKTLTSPTSQSAHMLAQDFAVPGIQTAATTATTSPTSDDMCFPYENSAFTETIKRQKTRRDKLATALRENKKKLGHVEEEINILIENLNPGESERLDYEIERLRTDCQQMLNEIENIRRYGQLTEAERLQLQQQPFPRQRPARPPPVLYPYQYQPAESDFLSPQNVPVCGGGSSTGAGSNQTSAATTPNSSHLLQPSSNVTYQQQRPDYVSHIPSYAQQPSTDEEDYSDSNTDGGDDDEPLERWPCSMCTFLNHPQLNICEACECVRILPGTVRIVPTAGAAAAAAVAVAAATPPPQRAAFIGNTSATAAAAAAALAAAAPAAIAHGSEGAGASAGATTATARTVAAE